MSYGTFANFVTYHTNRGTDVSAYAEAAVDAALIVGSSALDNRYRSYFEGKKAGGRAQVDEWPRTGAYDINGDAIPSDEIPREVENATYELALIQLRTPGALAINYTPSQYQSVAVSGAVSVSFTKFEGAGEVQTKFQIVDEIMSTLMTKSTSALSGNVSR